MPLQRKRCGIQDRQIFRHDDAVIFFLFPEDNDMAHSQYDYTEYTGAYDIETCVPDGFAARSCYAGMMNHGIGKAGNELAYHRQQNLGGHTDDTLFYRACIERKIDYQRGGKGHKDI